jgi:hypothetical protein
MNSQTLNKTNSKKIKIMTQFMYLLRGGDDMEKFSPNDMETHLAKWKVWMGGLAKSGKLAGGSPLNKAGKQIVGSNKSLTNGAFAKGVEVIGGYVMVNAENMDEAVELSKGCPIFDSATANIEVREVMGMN